jgi:uncharacterized protein lin1253/lin1744
MIDFTKADNKHIRSALRPPKSFFTECFSKFPIYVWENKTDKIVSSERSQKNVKVIQKRLTKISRLDFWDTHEYFLWIGVSKTRVEFQMYRIQQYFENGQENFSVALYNFEKFTEKEHLKLSVSYYGTTYRTGLSPLGNYRGAYADYWLLQSLEDVFKHFKKNDALKYLDFAKLEETNSLSNLPLMFPHIYKYRGIIEYAQKINARGIQKDLIGEIIPSYYGLGGGRHCHVNMGKLTFKFLRANKNVFKNSDEGFEDYKIRQHLEKALGVKVVPGFTKYFKNVEDLECIPKGIKLIRFQNWILKNSVRAYEYRDYQNMLENLGIAFEGDFRIMPKNFKKAHDDAVRAYNNMKDEQKRIEFANQLEKLLGLEQTIGNYTFVLPKELQELKAEGKALSHCVGSYADRVARGETVIVFVRQKEKVDNPLYTLEINKGKIVQLRGMKNRDAAADAWEASEKLLLFAKKHKIAV